ncbi:MAG: dTMP kinase [Gammaproteobacteria bacterium]|jgi:dTMP kinase
MNNKMIVIDGVDGSGKGVQTRLLHDTMTASGERVLLTREPGGSPAAEDIRKLLVEGEPEKWDSMTELLLMYASRRSHLADTIWPALEQGDWVISDRYADSSRAFQGVAGGLGLDLVETIHRSVVGSFEPELVLILDIPESIALQRALGRGGKENRFEKKGDSYHAQVRQAFLQIAASNQSRYHVINANQSISDVTRDIFSTVNNHFNLNLVAP